MVEGKLKEHLIISNVMNVIKQNAVFVKNANVHANATDTRHASSQLREWPWSCE
jgi:hypothetical protein